jgi:hypothetical protein
MGIGRVLFGGGVLLKFKAAAVFEHPAAGNTNTFERVVKHEQCI